MDRSQDRSSAGQRTWLYAASFGSVFPVVGTLLEIGVRGLPFGPTSVFAAQAGQPLLWIIDAAPFVLGAFGWVLGQSQREVDDLRAEAAAQRVAEEIDRFLELSVDPLAIMTREGEFLRISPGFTDVLGYALEDLQGLKATDLIHPEDRADGRGRGGADDPRVGDPIEGTEIRVSTKSGDHRWLQWSVVAVPDEDVLYALGRDRTDERLQREELVRARDAAEAGARAKSEFLANMSHELRTPMNGVMGMTSLALETELTDEQRMFLESIDESARHLLELITDLLDFSQIEADKLALQRAPFPPAAVIGKVVTGSRPKADEKGLALLYEEGVGLGWTLVGDEARLGQILAELIENAVKFTERGEIVVRAHCETHEGNEALLAMSVSDTGVGLDAEQKERVFEAFSQADGSLTRTHGGTGLGLTIAGQLVEMMRGTIRVESAVGSGSTFHVAIPMPLAGALSDASPRETPRPDDDEEVDLSVAEGPGAAKRVLLVEDNRVNRLLTEAFLVRRGYDVVVATDGLEAVERAREATFEFIVMDVQMPGMDGLEATRKIREMEKDRIRRTPIIALTAHVARGDREKCLRAGMDDYVSKPVDPERFEHVIQRQVYGPRVNFERSRALALLSGDEVLLRSTAREFVESASAQVRVILDALHRADKIALWQAARTLEAESSTLSLNRLRDVSHRIAVLIGRGRPDEALALTDELKSALQDAVAAVREGGDAA